MTLQEKIDLDQRRVIICSYIYYYLDDNIVSDNKYDEWCRRLVQYKNDYPDLWKTSEYYKQFGDDYNGCTGFTLYDDLDDGQKKIIQSIVNNIYRDMRGE